MPGTSVTAKLHAKMAAKKSHSFIEFLCTNELDSTPKVEPSVTLPIRQAFTFFYRIGLSPSRLRFDTKSGTYLRIKGSKLNQVGSTFNDFRIQPLTKTERRYFASH